MLLIYLFIGLVLVYLANQIEKEDLEKIFDKNGVSVNKFFQIKIMILLGWLPILILVSLSFLIKLFGKD